MSRGTTVMVALCAVALAIALIVIVSRSRSHDDDERAALEAEADDPIDPARSTREQAPEFAPAADEPNAATPPASPRARPEQPDDSLAAPLTPEVVDHAKLMAIPTTAMAIERRDVKHLHQFLQFIKEHREDKIVSETDIGAVEAAIACIEHAPDANEEAEDFLRFGAQTGLADALRKVCNAR